MYKREIEINGWSGRTLNYTQPTTTTITNIVTYTRARALTHTISLRISLSD